MRLLLAALLFALSSVAPCAEQLDVPPPLPIPVASFGAAAMPSGEIFIYGGHSGVRHKYNREEVHGALHRWKPGMAEWEQVGEDEPAQGASLVATEQGVIRIGGMAARNEKGAKQDLWSSETAARFDEAEKKWVPLPKLPQRRSSHDSALVGSTLHVIGGWALMGGSDLIWHDSYLTLDLSKADATWQTHPQPFKRRALAAQAVGTKLYAIGGMDSDDEMSNAVMILDTTTGRWSDGPALPKDKLGGFGFASVAHEGRIFASGASGVLLELRGDKWVGVAKLQHPRFFHRFVPGGKGRLIALGGESREGKKVPPESVALPAPDSVPLPEAETAKSDVTTTKAKGEGGGPATMTGWPRYQGPRGNGTSPEAAWRKDWPADGPPVLWKAEVGKGLASFAIADGRAYTAGNDGADHDTLWCFDLESGKTVWTHTFDAPTKCHEMPIVPYGPASTPTVEGDKAWFTSRDGHVLCVNAVTGAVLWQKHLVNDLGGKRPVYGYSNSPCVKDGRLYLDVGGSDGKSNACLDAASGQVLWQTGGGEAGYATPFLITRDGKEVLVMFKGQGFELREAANGKLLARYPMETRDFCNCATPVVIGDTFLLSHTGGEGTRALQWDGADKLAEKWNDRGMGLLFHSGVPVHGRVLAFNDAMRGANDLRLIDLKTGRNVWQDTTVARGTAVVSDDGHALLLTNTGELVLAKILEDKLEVLHRVQVLPAKSWVQPALANGRLICKNNDGAVVCLDLK